VKKSLLFATLAASLAFTACAKLKLTVRNDRRTPVKNVEVRAGSVSYTLPELAPGASDSREMKANVEGNLAVNFVSSEGGLYYTSSTTLLKKGKGHDLILHVTEKGSLDTEEKK
jgi:hypothetical protein